MDYTTLKPESCRACPLWQSPGPVWPAGDPRYARVVYVGQNPGGEEVEPLKHGQAGEPFIGPSGRVLNRQLFEANVSRSELYLTNQVKCLTPGSREPTAEEVECCKPLLAEDLARARADTVVLAGATAFKANIGTYSTLSPRYHPTDSIFSRMGCVEQRDGRKWIGTIHPAFIMRMPMFREAPIAHLKKALAISGVAIPLPRVIENPTPEDIERHKLAARAGGRFADDVETTQKVWQHDVEEDDFIGGDWDLTMCGISAVLYEAIILSPERVHEWSDCFGDPSLVQYEHNGEYDRFYLERYVRLANRRFDTCLGHHYLHSNMRKALKPHVVSLYTNLPYYDRKLGAVNEKLYCGMDNIATLLAGREIERQLREIRIDWTLPKLA